MSGQQLVVEAVVPLLVPQSEGGGQSGQLGGDVRLGGLQVSPAPQDGAFARLQQLRKREKTKITKDSPSVYDRNGIRRTFSECACKVISTL